MIYIETGRADIRWNLALEYYFTAEKDIGEEEIFLFWTTQPALIIGKFQNAMEEIDLNYAREKGIRVVRRLSGGGTIYADEGNWMFTFITRGDTDNICFQKYTMPILEALRGMGVDATFNGRNDLVIDGKKFSGNAQYKMAGKTVHHGTLMLNMNVEQMVRSTMVDDQKILSKSIKSVRDRVTNVSEYLPQKMDSMEFKRRMVDAVMGKERREYVLTPEDQARIGEIAETKFDGWDIIFGATPKFSIERVGRLPGGRMCFSMEIKRGCIERCGVSGDFFGTVDAAAFDRALRGCPYRRADVEQALLNGGLENAVMGISVKEMAAIIADQE